MKALPENIKRAIKTLADNDWEPKEIMELFGLSRSAVYQYGRGSEKTRIWKEAQERKAEWRKSQWG